MSFHNLQLTVELLCSNLFQHFPLLNVLKYFLILKINYQNIIYRETMIIIVELWVGEMIEEKSMIDTRDSLVVDMWDDTGQ